MGLEGRLEVEKNMVLSWVEEGNRLWRWLPVYIHNLDRVRMRFVRRMLEGHAQF
jgi:hypothetical protein